MSHLGNQKYYEAKYESEEEKRWLEQERGYSVVIEDDINEYRIDLRQRINESTK